MFERFAEGARRVIFFSRYHASNYGSMVIESEHLLLGLLQEDRTLAGSVAPSVSADIFKAIEREMRTAEKVSTSIDLPLSAECKRILSAALRESEDLGHPVIGTDHLLLGILSESSSKAAQVLRQFNLDRAPILERMRQTGPPEG